jgi:hypothetical protein
MTSEYPLLLAPPTSLCILDAQSFMERWKKNELTAKDFTHFRQISLPEGVTPTILEGLTPYFLDVAGNNEYIVYGFDMKSSAIIRERFDSQEERGMYMYSIRCIESY